MLNPETFEQVEKIIQIFENNFDFSSTKIRNNRKENLLFILKNHENVIIDIARHCYLRIYEGLNELYNNYAKIIREAGLNELVMKFSNSRKYSLQIKYPQKANWKHQAKPATQQQPTTGNENELSSDEEMPNNKAFLTGKRGVEIPIHSKTLFVNKLTELLKQEVILCRWKNDLLEFTTSPFSNLNKLIEEQNDSLLEGSFDKVQEVYNLIRNDLYFLIELNYAIANHSQ